jgi:hypothetical protein
MAYDAITYIKDTSDGEMKLHAKVQPGAVVEVVDDGNDDDNHTLYYEQCSTSRGMLCNQ